jgi:cell division protein FtsZ
VAVAAHRSTEKPVIDRDLEGARIVVLGVGGGGSNAVDRLIAAGVRGVEFAALNTDQQALNQSRAAHRIGLGQRAAHGLGAGGDPTVGQRTAEECAHEIEALCQDADMVFIAAGMGGGTGTGASPVVAQIAQDSGALTVGVVTKPFAFEGSRRRRNADAGISNLRERLNTLIVIPNDRVLNLIDRRTSLEEAFNVVDDVLRQGIQGISELITRPGLINLDFADVRTVMSEPGIALMAIGSAQGDDRAAEAAQLAMASPLLDLSMQGARGVLFNVTGAKDITLGEINRAADIIRQAADPDANIIFGAVLDESLGNEVRITVIATGFESTYRHGPAQSFVTNGANSDSHDEPPGRTHRPDALRPEGPDLPRTLRGLREESRGLDEPLPRMPDWLRRRDRDDRP